MLIAKSDRRAVNYQRKQASKPAVSCLGARLGVEARVRGGGGGTFWGHVTRVTVRRRFRAEDGDGSAGTTSLTPATRGALLHVCPVQQAFGF